MIAVDRDARGRQHHSRARRSVARKIMPRIASRTGVHTTLESIDAAIFEYQSNALPFLPGRLGPVRRSGPCPLGRRSSPRNSRCSLRISSENVLMRVRISDSRLERFSSNNRIAPMWHRAHGSRPLMATVSASKGQDLRAGRDRLGCPTGQARGSTRASRRIFRLLPLTQKFPSDVYDHKTRGN